MAKQKSQARYVDGFIIPLKKNGLPLYKKMATLAAKVWIDHGALDYRECIGDEVNPDFGLPFPKMAKIKSNEIVVFAWISFKSKAHRNKVNASVMKDKRIQKFMDPKTMPFDTKRMAYGGFTVLVNKQ